MSQNRLSRAANRLRFTPKEQKFVTVRVTNIVVLTAGVIRVKVVSCRKAQRQNARVCADCGKKG
jgi:hypothetical protein